MHTYTAPVAAVPSAPPAVSTEAEANLSRSEAQLTQLEGELRRWEQQSAARVDELENERTQLERGIRAMSVPGAAALLQMMPQPIALPEPGETEANAARAKAIRARQAAADVKRTALATCDKQALRAMADLQDVQKRMEALKAVVVPPPVPAADPFVTVSVAEPVVVDERRTQERMRIRCEVDMETQTNFFSGFGWDLSSGGLFVASFDSIPVGAEIDLSFTLPGGIHVDATAVVRWTRDHDGYHHDALPGVGLQFTRISAASQSAIERFLNSREPMFYVS